MKKPTKKKAKPKKAPAPRGGKKNAAGTTVTIRDAGLRKGLAQALRDGAVSKLQIDLQALAEVREINWSEDQAEAFPDQWESIGDLKGLEHAVSLRELTVWGNSISSLAPLAPLTELEEVWAFENDIKTTAGLANKPKLRSLNLNYNPIETIADLRGLPALEEVELNGTKVADLSPLLDLPKLRKLEVSRVEKARTGKNLQVLLTLAERKVVLSMDPELQQAFDHVQAAALAKQPSDDPIIERFRTLGQPVLAQLWAKGGAAAKDDKWNTLLHRVVLLGDKELKKQGDPDAVRCAIIKELARAGVDVDARNEEFGNHTALSLAVEKGQSPGVIQALLDAGASVRLPRRVPVLAVALKNGGAGAVIEKLVAAGADVTHPAVLAEAAEKDAVELVGPAARAIDWRKQIHLNKPALSTALQGKRDRMVNLLLEAGAPAGAGAGYPAVFFAHSVAMLEKLIAHGADPLVKTNYGTALHRLRTSSPEALALIDRLVDLGVPIDARDFDGKTALFEVTEDATDNPAVLKLAEKLIARGADPNVRIWHPDPVEWREAWTLLDAKHGSEVIRKLGGVTTAVWANRQVKIVTGAKDLEGEALQALTELALAGLMKKLGAAQARIEKKVSAMLKAQTDAVSKALAPFGVHPLTLLWLARGVHGRDLFDRGMLQIAAELRVQPEKELAAKIHPLLRALCDAGAPVEVRDARGAGALDAYLGRARGYNFTPDTALVRALIPKSREVMTRAVAEHLAGIASPLPPEINAVLDILVEAGADLTEPKAFSRLCRARRPDLVRRALEAGADPAWDSDSSDCALQQALYVDDVNVVEILLDAGAPPDIGWEGSSLAFFETRSGEALEALRRHKLDVSLRGGYDNRTLLDEAVKRAVGLLSNWSGYGPEVNNAAVRFVAHLVSAGWSLDAVDHDGKTPRARLQAIKNEHGRAALTKAGLLD